MRRGGERRYAVLGLIIAVLACIAAWLVIPEVRQFFSVLFGPPIPTITSFDYQVRVQTVTGEPINSAKVIIDVGNGIASKDGFTDSNGLARIFIDSSRAGKPGRLTVLKTGHKPYVQNIDLTQADLPDVIQLEEEVKQTDTTSIYASTETAVAIYLTQEIFTIEALQHAITATWTSISNSTSTGNPPNQPISLPLTVTPKPPSELDQEADPPTQASTHTSTARPPDTPTHTPTSTSRPPDTPTHTPTTAPPPTITKTVPPPPPNYPPGDANEDCIVDDADYEIYQAHFGQSTENGHRDGDFNEDGFVDGHDYTIWWTNYGATCP